MCKDMNPSENTEFGQPITRNYFVICQEGGGGGPDVTRRSMKACFYVDDDDIQ
jgi:hypothetical protein